MLRVAMFISVMALCAACGAPDSPSTTAATPTPAVYDITYRVVGSRGVHAAIGFTSAAGAFEQLADVPLNWSYVLTVEPGTELSVTAQSLDRSLVTCSIEVGGVPVSKETAGRTAPASCSSRTPWVAQ